ncbi:hypothetical protein BU25DRAFT_413976 [Macroventuria anomochaeta]|uniref:Uncharacterized protein n=1 Tax=Macroventuria anomochaeta TaxID=301207 RepID=A0ACB6RPJ3_9PLEO|nr:uncharacterized protein BU25DRAFT_413976 [Macroventuria anomochaeta]KAF2623806.1 hypothetical protein BU25DRAFT_413976 [Macroventuria anomochaeta]
MVTSDVAVRSAAMVFTRSCALDNMIGACSAGRPPAIGATHSSGIARLDACHSCYLILAWGQAHSLKKSWVFIRRGSLLCRAACDYSEQISVLKEAWSPSRQTGDEPSPPRRRAARVEITRRA